jgi:hypothetical protein
MAGTVEILVTPASRLASKRGSNENKKSYTEKKKEKNKELDINKY